MKQILRQIFSDRRGTAAVEFAIICPLFLTTTFGTLAYGIYIGAAHSTAQLAAEAARASVAGLNDNERKALAENYIAAHAKSYPLLNANDIKVAAAPAASNTNDFRVEVTYDGRKLPIWQFAKFLPLPSKTLVRTAVVNHGGY